MTAMPRRSPTNTLGFTLVETLVALVVLAVGLLGIAGLYLEGLRAGRTSVFRSAAVTLVSDMADRIRANPAGSYAGTGPGEDNGCVNGTLDCGPDLLAQDDWFRWLADVRRRLPEGATAAIQREAIAPLTQFEITVAWPEPGQEQPATYTLALQL